MLKNIRVLSKHSGLFLLLLFGTLVPSFAQQTLSGQNWYFGNTTNGIRFNRTDDTPALVNKAVPFGTGGSAVASDPANGDLLFYTDGSNIYDNTNQIIPNGTGLGANTAANQPVVVARMPGTTSLYYVIVRDAATGDISYRQVDMSLPGNAVFPNPPQGAATSATNTAIAGLNAQSDGMITIVHDNGEDFWLITHDNNAANYRVTQFTTTGPLAPVAFNNIGAILSSSNFSNHFITSVPPTTNSLIAVSSAESNRNAEIINFDRATGVITFNKPLLNTGAPTTAPNPSVYDIEWSNSGQYLYISRHGDAGVQADVLQVDINNGIATPQSILPQPNNIFRSYGLQMGPDSLIYHLYQATGGGPFLLGSIADSDTIASEVVYDPSAFASSPDFNATQFSAFIPQNPTLNVDFTFEGTCANSPVSFYPTVTPAADSLVWSFGETPPQTATGWSPVHTYTADGDFDVVVTAYLNGQTATATHRVTINPFDLQLQLVQDTTACACELPANNGKPTRNGSSCPDDKSDDFNVDVQVSGTGTPTFQWFGPGGLLASQTTKTLRPDSAGYYYVVATIGACSAYAGVNIKEYDSLDQRANIWHFGKNAGIDFNPLPEKPAKAIVGPLDTPEGCSVISDRNGQVVFSTDGQRIYIRNPIDPTQYQEITPVPNPPGLGGEPGSSQSALIMPVPGDETLYYIFTTQEVHGTYEYQLKYSLFDKKLNNGIGGLAQYNQLLFAKSTERITGNDSWLIAHEYGNNSFRAYNISQNGIGNPIISAIGSAHETTSESQGQGYMKLGAQNRLAVALSDAGSSNVVEIFDFVDSLGTVTNYRKVDLNSASEQVYGVEFSSGGNKLYVTLKDASSKIVEIGFDPDNDDAPVIKQTVNQNGELGAIQIGPDGQLYVAINGSNNLGTFGAVEDFNQLTPLPNPLQPFPLAAGTNSTLGLPNFTQIIANPTMTPGLTVTGLCLGDSTYMTAVGKDPAIDKFDWDFGDGQRKFDGPAQIAHLYTAPGIYTVTVVIKNKCENPVGTFTQTIEITNKPPDPTKAVNICNGAVPLDANPNDLAGLTYLWSTGETTETINVTQPNTYDVTITDAKGCTRDGQLIATDSRPIVDLGPDQTICQNAVIQPLNAQNPGADYVWTINGVAASTTQTQAVTTTSITPNVYTYAVTVTDPVTTCSITEDITFTINATPVFTAASKGDILCTPPGATGTIDLNITAPASSTFTYFVNGPVTNSQTNQTTGLHPIAGLTAGAYSITVADQVSGCSNTSTASINNTAFTINAIQNGTCDPDLKIDVTLAGGTATAPFKNYKVINSNTGAIIYDVNTPPAINFTTQELPSGFDYVVQFTDGNDCVASSASVPLTQGTAFTVDFSLVDCVTQEITAIPDAAATTYVWSILPPAGGVVTPTADPETVQLPVGSYTVQVIVDDGIGGLCQGIGTMPVVVKDPPNVDFKPNTECADQVILTASVDPTGLYTYRWYRDGILIPGGKQINAGVADNGIDYRVEAYSSESGCTYPSVTKPLTIIGQFTATIAGTLACEGQPLTLTATTTPTASGFEWKFGKDDLTNETSNILEVLNPKDGRYTLTASLATCQAIATYDVAVAEVTEGQLMNSATICPDPENPEQIDLDAGQGFRSYNWFKDQVTLGYTEQVYTATQPGTYTVDLVNVFGCPSTDMILLVEDCTPRITGPNAIRPGGVNTEFFLYTFYVDDEDFHIFIFNRWGEMVYESPERDFRWNGGVGNNLSKPVPPGTYSYVVKYKSSYRPEDGVKETRGGVVVLR